MTAGDETTEVIVVLGLDLAKSCRGDAVATSESRTFEGRVSAIGVELVPLFPDIEPEFEHMVVQFSGQLPDDAADEKLRQLRGLSGVEAAYLKPRGELPAGGGNESDLT